MPDEQVLGMQRTTWRPWVTQCHTACLKCPERVGLKCSYPRKQSKGNGGRGQVMRMLAHLLVQIACVFCVWSVASVCLTLCDPMDCSPPGSSVHGILQARNIGVGCHALLQGVFLTQGWNPSLLHWQADSLPLSHLGSPVSPGDESKPEEMAREQSPQAPL